MIVGVLSIKVFMRQSRTLKDKRRIIKSLKDRIRNKFNVSISETGMQDNRQLAVIGVAMVASGRRFVNGTLSSVIDFFSIHPQVELLDYDMEFF